LNESCYCGTVRVWRRIILQRDTQVIRLSGRPAGSALPEFDGGPGGHCRRSRGRQIARDLVNFGGREAVLFLLLTTAQKNHKKQAGSEQPESRSTVYLDSKTI
jgi:hypothetical protein